MWDVCKGEVIEEDTREIVKAPSVETGKTGVLSTGLSRWIQRRGLVKLAHTLQSCQPYRNSMSVYVHKLANTKNVPRQYNLAVVQVQCTHTIYQSVITFKFRFVIAILFYRIYCSATIVPVLYLCCFYFNISRIRNHKQHPKGFCTVLLFQKSQIASIRT